MPLSEHEQQMLEQMEQALASEDPRFAHQMRGGTTLAVRRRRLVLGILGVVIGLALVVVGVNTTMWVGAVGFAVMVAAAAYAFTPVKEGDASAQAAAQSMRAAFAATGHDSDVLVAPVDGPAARVL